LPKSPELPTLKTSEAIGVNGCSILAIPAILAILCGPAKKFRKISILARSRIGVCPAAADRAAQVAQEQ
jgi:hypothetical protein